MQPGPCVVCGEVNYPLSMGGPSICPSCDCGKPPIEKLNHLRAQLAQAMRDMEVAQDRAANLLAFKNWVHTYLDKKGIPHHPPGTHGAEGCRIGDRMDYVFAAKEQAERERDEQVGLYAKLLMDAQVWRADRDRLAAEVVALREALEKLTALVRGECPALLDELRGGDAKLDMEIDALAQAPDTKGGEA